MTREEAKSCIYTIKLLRTLALNIHGVIDIVDDENCKKMIKVLEQEFCEDAISRLEVKKIIDQAILEKNFIEDDKGWDVLTKIKDLPPVTSTKHKEKWINTEQLKEIREKLSKWIFTNSEEVCGNSMIDIDYLQGHISELLLEYGIDEVE